MLARAEIIIPFLETFIYKKITNQNERFVMILQQSVFKSRNWYL